MCLLISIILIFLVVSEIMSFIPKAKDKEPRNDEGYEEGYEKRIWRD